MVSTAKIDFISNSTLAPFMFTIYIANTSEQYRTTMKGMERRESLAASTFFHIFAMLNCDFLIVFSIWSGIAISTNC